MNDHHWMQDLQWQDVSRPLEDLPKEAVYTLLLGDLLTMPDLNFREIALSDRFVRALLN
jgi:hypothetical protein